MKNKKEKKRLTKRLILLFILVVAINVVIRLTAYFLLSGQGQEILFPQEDNMFIPRILYLGLNSILVGVLLFIIVHHKLLKPIDSLTKATKEIAQGNFDVTVEKFADDEIADFTDSFNKMVKELASLDYLKKDFISNVSHEFKTPLSIIDGYIDLLEDENITPEERKEYLNTIREETGRLTNLSTNALRLSKLENQEEPKNRQEFSLDEQIRKCILLLENSWNKKKIKMNVKLANVSIYNEPELLEQVWINLLNNSIKFSNENGTISVNLLAKNKIATVIIEDKGIGIEKEKIERIFEKFYQTDKSHSKEGNGLGLAIVQRIIRLCDGTINVESEIGKGTKFTIELPITQK